MSNPQKDINEWQPQWVALRILDFGRIIHKFGSDDKALAMWVRQFSEDLIFNNTETEDVFTKQLLEEATETYATRVTAAKKAGKASAKARANKKKSKEAAGYGGAQNESTTDLEELNDQVPDKVSTNGDAAASDGAEDCRHPINGAISHPTTVSNPVTDGDIREDSQNVPDGSNSGKLESGTSAAGDSFGEARQSQTGAGAPSVREKSCLEAPAPQGSRRVKQKRPKNAAEVVAWAADHGIDEVDARDWYELNFVIRPGCDKDGVVIENWPGHCISYCRAVKEKRESA